MLFSMNTIPSQAIKDLERAARIIDSLYKVGASNTKLANASRMFRKAAKRLKSSNNI